MNIGSKKKIVILGMISKMPVAGVVWQYMHYLVGFQRLGYDVYYVESHAHAPTMLMESKNDDGTKKAVAHLATIMRRFDLTDRWAFHAIHDDCQCYGMTELQLKELYRTADLIINMHGGTLPLPEHYATGRLVYLETDPVQLQIELYDNLQSTIDFLEPHCAFFTFGENYGQSDCGLPVSDRFHFLPTRQPVICDYWEHSDGPTNPAFTTIGNWNQSNRMVTFRGEPYYWSKHFEFLKFIDLPSLTSQTFELALGKYGEADKQLLDEKGWRVRHAWDLSVEIDPYRQYIQESRGEFTVAKDQNVRLRSGWFSDRSATYLAAGRPVITQETGFSNILPTGAGLFGFLTLDEAATAVDTINTDYDRHSRAAREIAREYFSYDVVIGKLLADLGLESQSTQPRDNSRDASSNASGLNSQTEKHECCGSAVATSRSLSIVSDQDQDQVMLISCLGDDDTGGGMFVFDGSAVTQIDRLSTTGLCVAHDRVSRLLRSSPELDAAGELLVYDECGVKSYLRIDHLADAHDVLWDGNCFVVVSTSTNAVLWLTPAGETLRTWRAPGQGDAWHLNNLLVHEGRLHVSAFGHFHSHREWCLHKQEPLGIVFDLERNADVLTGLSFPHFPRFVDGAWVVCNSGNQELPPRLPITCQMAIKAPPTVGTYCLRLTLVQEQVAWFDDLDQANVCEGRVDVGINQGFRRGDGNKTAMAGMRQSADEDLNAMRQPD